MFSMSFFAHRMAHLCLLASVLCCAPSARAVEQLSGFVDQSLDGRGWFFGNFRGPNERLSASAENDAGLMISLGTFGTTDTFIGWDPSKKALGNPRAFSQVIVVLRAGN
jgi:hypothetical protein